MALDATVAGSASNSYLTLAEADQIAADQGVGPADKEWIAAADSAKEQALIRATGEIDAALHLAGVRFADAQTLLFPRSVDESGGVPFLLPHVKLATYAQAIYVLRNAESLDNADSRRARGLLSFSDADGSGSVISNRDDYGVISARAMQHLRSIRGLGRTTLRSVWVSGSSPLRRVYGSNSRP